MYFILLNQGLAYNVMVYYVMVYYVMVYYVMVYYVMVYNVMVYYVMVYYVMVYYVMAYYVMVYYVMVYYGRYCFRSCIVPFVPSTLESLPLSFVQCSVRTEYRRGVTAFIHVMFG